MDEDDAKKTHPGFTITCDNCGSTRVYVENTLGFSGESGAWGEVSIVCDSCDATTDVVTS